jgi:predicted ester cyclase
MDKIDIVRKAFNLNTSKTERDSYYADGFQATDSSSDIVLDKATWLQMGEVYRTSVPDLGFVMDEIHQEGQDVLATGHFTGTFMKDLDLTGMNLGVIKATGRKLKFPVRTSRVSFNGDQIIRNHSLSSGPTDGLTDFLAVFKES